jgi:hypothetical protein
MITVRWVTGSQDKLFTRDENFPTRRAAKLAMSRVIVNNVRRFGRLYVVQIGKGK